MAKFFGVPGRKYGLTAVYALQAGLIAGVGFYLLRPDQAVIALLLEMLAFFGLFFLAGCVSLVVMHRTHRRDVAPGDTDKVD